ncbi:hypothetical protein BGZ50_005266 [Haplosporangium sp. Z 11]|nr:hypothetical protein BGZ50_005266 [Haplosporangium sp. Z 11]
MVNCDVIFDGLEATPLDDSATLLKKINRAMEYLLSMTSQETEDPVGLVSPLSHLKFPNKEKKLAPESCTYHDEEPDSSRDFIQDTGRLSATSRSEHFAQLKSSCERHEQASAGASEDQGTCYRVIRICVLRSDEAVDVLKPAKAGLISNNVTVATTIRGSHKCTKVCLYIQQIVKGLQMIKKHMDKDFHLLMHLALEADAEENALIKLQNGEITELELKVLWCSNSYLLLSSFICKLEVSILSEKNCEDLAQVMKRDAGLEELKIICQMENMAEVYTFITDLRDSHYSLEHIQLKTDNEMVCS